MTHRKPTHLRTEPVAHPQGELEGFADLAVAAALVLVGVVLLSLLV